MNFSHDAAWLEAAKKRFDFHGWSQGDDAGQQHTVRAFSLNIDSDSTGWAFEQRAVYGDSGYADYFHRLDDPSARAMVRVTEYDTRSAAETGLLETLSMSMAVTLPRLDAVRNALGDVAFGGHDELDQSVVFLRANIVVDVRSIGDKPISILDLAKRTDAQILTAESNA